MKVDELEYDLPDSAIAQTAAEPRDSARLLDTRTMTDHIFTELPALFEPGDLVVVNDTRVRRARLSGNKAGSGGHVELLILGGNEDGTWSSMIRPARRIRPGTVVEVGETAFTVVDGPRDGVVRMEVAAADVEALLDRVGEMPLPPYFHGTLDDDDRYQTMFARAPGSAAAPTAGLHFTSRVVEGLVRRGVSLAYVDLHVGIDTFRPMAVEDTDDHRMHTEWCSVPVETAEAVEEARGRGGRVVAIGTTTTRTLESLGRPDGLVSSGVMETDLFLRPGSPFTVVDLMVTNFHVPGSTLIAMIAGFMGEGWRAAYRHALESGYRFLSFGDAMLCERER